MIDIALNGSILQFLKACEETIRSWITDGASNYASTNINNKYLPLTGGTVSGMIKTTLSSDQNQPEDKVEFTQFEGNMGANDFWRLAVGIEPYETTGTDSGNSYVSLDVSDDNGTEAIFLRQYKGGHTNQWTDTDIRRTATLLGSDGNTSFPGTVSTPAVLTTGDSTSKTQAITDSSTKIATTEFVNNYVNNRISNITAGSLLSATGSDVEPIYIGSNGFPAKCKYKLEKSVPSNALFTDTVYSHPSPSAASNDIKGKPTANASPGFGDTFTVSQVQYNSTGHITKLNDMTVKIPDTVASQSAKGLMSSNDKTKLDNLGSGITISSIINLIYPVGSIYISTVSTDPKNIFANTTWEQIKGRFLISAGKSISTTYTAGNTGGAETIALTSNNLPAHTHTTTVTEDGSHTHTRGSMNITGTISASVETYSGDITGAFYEKKQYATVGGHGYVVSGVGFDASRQGAWTGETSNAGNHKHTVTVNSTGSGAAFNNLPPYLVVYMWKRLT